MQTKSEQLKQQQKRAYYAIERLICGDCHNSYDKIYSTSNQFTRHKPNSFDFFRLHSNLLIYLCLHSLFPHHLQQRQNIHSKGLIGCLRNRCNFCKMLIYYFFFFTLKLFNCIEKGRKKRETNCCFQFMCFFFS